MARIHHPSKKAARKAARKSPVKGATFTFRLPRPLKKRINSHAKTHRKAAGEFVREVIEDHFNTTSVEGNPKP